MIGKKRGGSDEERQPTAGPGKQGPRRGRTEMILDQKDEKRYRRNNSSEQQQQ